MNLGENIRKARKRRAFPQSELAERLQSPPERYKQVGEWGARTDNKMFAKICRGA